MAFEVGKRVVAESESIDRRPRSGSLRKCCAAIRRLAIASAGTTATRASTHPQAAPSGPNNAQRGNGKRHHGNVSGAARGPAGTRLCPLTAVGRRAPDNRARTMAPRLDFAAS
jgi:hypothetical protein